MDILKFDKEWKSLKALLSVNKKIVIITHQNPDGDAIGSSLGLYWYLVNCGNTTHVVVPNEYPEFLQWLPGNQNVVNYSKNRSEAVKIINECDIIFHLDFNDLKRTGDLQSKLEKAKAINILIDHHPNPQIDSKIIISDTTASSTSEIVLEFILQMGGDEELDLNISQCLYLGIMTDTGCFSFNSSNSRTFELVSKLLKLGINKDEIYRLVYDNFSANRMKLMGYCLNEKMQVLPEFSTAYISLSLEEQKHFNFEIGDSEGFVNLPLSIKGVCFTALFMEREEKIKISLRSRGNFAVNTIAEKYFSGGGHLNASGGESKLSLEETINLFKSLLPQLTKELIS
jgi:bifunctional oligoribonuclease and PAP phosphatase NrnA